MKHRALAPRPALGWAVRRLRELADPITTHRAGPDGLRDAGPMPPRRLRARTGAPGIREFGQGGRQAADELAAVLEAAGAAPLERYAAVLDFGCGSARVLPHVSARAPGARCAGCDVDPVAIDWAARRHPELEFCRSAFAPPLPFADGSFDLLYSISVFSHLDESMQDRWLRDLARVLRDGAVALLSIHGAHAFEQFRTGAVKTGWCDPGAFARGSLAPDEFVFAGYRRSIWNRGELPGVGSEYGLAFHGERYVRSRWAEVFEIVRIAPRALTGWQDVVVCRKR
jgi:SAM-dependent methyltransferase